MGRTIAVAFAHHAASLFPPKAGAPRVQSPWYIQYEVGYDCHWIKETQCINFQFEMKGSGKIYPGICGE